MSTKKGLWAIAVVTAIFVVAGCGEDGGSGSGGTGGSSATSSGGGGATSSGGDAGSGGAGTPQSGAIRVTVEGITGSAGLILLAGLAGSNEAYSCTMIGEDPFGGTEPLHAVTGDNPCALAAEAKVFSPGDYNLFAITIQGGEQTPKRCVTFPATVNGDVEVLAPSFDQWVTGACQ